MRTHHPFRLFHSIDSSFTEILIEYDEWHILHLVCWYPCQKLLWLLWYEFYQSSIVIGPFSFTPQLFQRGRKRLCSLFSLIYHSFLHRIFWTSSRWYHTYSCICLLLLRCHLECFLFCSELRNRGWDDWKKIEKNSSFVCLDDWWYLVSQLMWLWL